MAAYGSFGCDLTLLSAAVMVEVTTFCPSFRQKGALVAATVTREFAFVALLRRLYSSVAADAAET